MKGYTVLKTTGNYLALAAATAAVAGMIWLGSNLYNNMKDPFDFKYSKKRTTPVQSAKPHRSPQKIQVRHFTTPQEASEPTTVRQTNNSLLSINPHQDPLDTYLEKHPSHPSNLTKTVLGR